MEKQLIQCNDLICAKKRQLLLYYNELDKKRSSTSDVWNMGIKTLMNVLPPSLNPNRIPNNRLQDSKFWPWRNFYLLNNIKQDSHIKKLSDEIYSLVDFQHHLSSDLLQLQIMLKKVKFSNTLVGRFYDIAGHIFSAYCCWKILSSLINIIFKRTGSVDGVTLLIEWFAPLFTTVIDLRFWTQQVFLLILFIYIIR